MNLLHLLYYKVTKLARKLGVGISNCLCYSQFYIQSTPTRINPLSQRIQHHQIYLTVFDYLPALLSVLATLLLALCLPVSTDEINSLVIYASSWQSLLLQDYPNNHTLTTTLAYGLTHFFGVNLYLVRMISVVALLAMLGLVFHYCKRPMALLFLLGLLLNPYGLAYAAVFRGYFLQALLVLVVFLYYYKRCHALSFKDYLVLDLIFCLNTAHLMSSVYLWIPFKMALILTQRDKKAWYQQSIAGGIAGTLILLILLAKILLTGYAEGIPHLSPPTIQHFLLALQHEWRTVFQAGTRAIFSNIFVTRHLEFVLSNHLKPILGLLMINALILMGVLQKKNNKSSVFCLLFLVGSVLTYVLFDKYLPDRNWIMYIPALCFIFAWQLPTLLSLYCPDWTGKIRFQLYALQSSCLVLLLLNPSYQSIFHEDETQFFNINRANISDLIKEESALTALFEAQHNLLCQMPAYLDKNLRLLYLYAYQYHCNQRLSLNQVHQFYKDDHLAQKKILLSAEHFPLRIPDGYRLIATQMPYTLYTQDTIAVDPPDCFQSCNRASSACC